MARTSRKHLYDADLDDNVQHHSIIYKAGAYLRLSVDDVKKRGDSLETQRNIIKDYLAAAPDITLTKVYEDNKTTGTNFERPGFKQMLSDVENGEINCIIVKDFTRFGRNAIDCGYYLEQHLPSLGARFVAITDSYDSLDDIGGIILPLKNIINEAYALDISKKVRAVHQQNIKDGRFVGLLAPYGYKKSVKDCHQLVVDEETSPIVKDIFKWALAGKNITEICRSLTICGIKTPSHINFERGHHLRRAQRDASNWSRSTVYDILSDRVYIGELVQGKTHQDSLGKSKIDPSLWVHVPNAHEPIVSKADFDKIQLLRAASAEKHSAIKQHFTKYTDNLFRGKVLCPTCGYKMSRKRQNKDGSYWFRCNSQNKYGKQVCTIVSVRETDLISGVLESTFKLAEVILGRFVSLLRRTESEASHLEQLSRVNSDIGKYSRILRSLYENMVSELITKDEYMQMKFEYEQKLVALGNEANSIRKSNNEVSSLEQDYGDVRTAIIEAASDNAVTGELIERLVKEIHVFPDKSFKIHFKFQDVFSEVMKFE